MISLKQWFQFGNKYHPVLILWSHGRIRSTVSELSSKVWLEIKVALIRKRNNLLDVIDRLDIKAETTPLSNSEREELKVVNENISKLRRDEEIIWAQHAKVKQIQEGGNNTKYVHLIANGKHRRKKIFQLEHDEGTIIGQENIKNYITEFYKNLFGPPSENHFSLVEEEINDIPQLSQEENEILIADFTED
jgi:hypothetical protein